MGKGRRAENELVNAVNRATPDYIDAVANGYSGSHATCQTDILVRTPTLDHAIEHKTFGWPTGVRGAVADEDDLEDLANSVNAYTRSWHVVSWANRELVVCGPVSVTTTEAVGERLVSTLPPGVKPSFTGSNYVRATKADTDVLESAQAGRSDVEVLADHLNLDLEDSVATDGQ